MMQLNDIFQLPETALAGNKRIMKKMLITQADLTKHEQKILDKITCLELFATVQKSTTWIPPYIDQERDIESIIMLRCEMGSGSTAFSEVGQLLHKSFPNPTLIWFDATETVCISVSLTRKSHAERGTTVIDQIVSTGGFDLSNKAYQPFYDALSFDRLPQNDLLAYLDGIIRAVKLSKVIPGIGIYPQCNSSEDEHLFELIDERDAVLREAEEIQSARHVKDITFNESAKLRIELSKILKQSKEITAEIEELCYGRN